MRVRAGGRPRQNARTTLVPSGIPLLSAMMPGLLPDSRSQAGLPSFPASSPVHMGVTSVWPRRGDSV